jgi:peroxiredoxin
MPKLQPVLAVAALCALLSPAPRAETPRPASDLVIHLKDGKDLRVSQFKGKPTVLAFILTTCPHCQKTVGFLSKAHAEFAERGLGIVAAAIEEAAAKNLPGFLATFNPPFPVGYNTDQKIILEFLQHPPMLLLKMPVLVFIDAKGIVRAQYEGDAPFLAEDKQEQNIRHEIEGLLAGGLAPGKKAAARSGGAEKTR